MKSITVFCGSSFGTDKIYEEQAFLLGQTLAKENIQLVLWWFGNRFNGEQLLMVL